MKIANRTFIISGGSSGLGLATTTDLLSSPNTYVAILDLLPPPSLPDNTRFKFFQLDISINAEVTAAVCTVVAWTRETGARLGGVINCAGVGRAAKIIDSNNEPHSLELWDFSLAVNLTGAFNLTRLALAHMVTLGLNTGNEGKDEDEDERGVVIFVSSSAAFEGQVGQTAYAASKGALTSMVLPLARDLARHAVRVVAIAPGAFTTPMTDLMSERVRKSIIHAGVTYPLRFGRPDEFAQTVRWVLECAYVNGETIRLNAAGRLPARM